jgi:hypothetical protein
MILDQIKLRLEKNDLIRSEIMLFLIFKNNDLRMLPYILVGDLYTHFGECVTHIWWNIYLFFGHVVLDPPAVTNIFSVPEPKTANGHMQC